MGLPRLGICSKDERGGSTEHGQPCPVPPPAPGAAAWISSSSFQDFPSSWWVGDNASSPFLSSLCFLQCPTTTGGRRAAAWEHRPHVLFDLLPQTCGVILGQFLTSLSLKFHTHEPGMSLSGHHTVLSSISGTTEKKKQKTNTPHPK